MNKSFDFSNIFNESIFQEIHESSLGVLEETGMKFLSGEMLNALKKCGSNIDFSKKIARIPKKFVEEKLEQQQIQVKNGAKQVILNGGVCSRIGEKISCKFGSGAFYIYDWESKNKVRATEKHVKDAIQFGNALEDVGMVGVPIIPQTYEGREINPDFLPIIRAAMVALNTEKVGNNEVNTPLQLKYLMEMGTVVRGSRQKYIEHPCFITAKHTISPLQLDMDACDVLLALAKNSLPSNIIPMPIIGTSVPVTLKGAMVLANAEILGTMAAVKSIVGDAIVLAGVMPATTDMKTGYIDYDTPEAIKMNMAMTYMYEEFYNFDFGLGNYCSDAKYLGPEILQQRQMHLMSAVIMKRLNPPIGLYDKGMIFSPELALVEIEIMKYLTSIFSGIRQDNTNEIMDVINEIGPGGSFLVAQHTLNNFKSIFKSEILRDESDLIKDIKIKGIFDIANEKYKSVCKNINEYSLPDDKKTEINKILKFAERDITGV